MAFLVSVLQKTGRSFGGRRCAHFVDHIQVVILFLQEEQRPVNLQLGAQVSPGRFGKKRKRQRAAVRDMRGAGELFRADLQQGHSVAFSASVWAASYH